MPAPRPQSLEPLPPRPDRGRRRPTAATAGTDRGIPDPPGVHRITLLAGRAATLCDDARAVIERVAGELGEGFDERDITASPEDLREYWDKIPVTLVDGVQIDFWRISEARLRAALSRPH